MSDGWGIVMVLGMLGVWALVAVAIVWVVRSTRTPTVSAGGTSLPSPGGSTGSAERILAERLARGDIDPEEYRSRLEALSTSGAP
ncbi:SHOCT domain-containing protein [Nocardioides sp.]|uniref:SHOCT domain-containing protein n=1 Tax=Nocardioides sp. TaxID=35761 RepID=UPI0027342E9A|nr:SHOCT domain-containing protein [Nocardioides sp.]